MWRQRRYTVLFIERDSATLRDDEGVEVEVAVDELGGSATPVPSDTSGLLHLSLQVADIEPGMDPWLQACIRIEAARDEFGVGKAVETERAWLEMRLGKPVSTRRVERRLKVFREQGTTTAGKRAPRKSTWDPRLIEAINFVLEGKSRSSTVSQTTAIEQITRRIERLHGDSVDVLPTTRSRRPRTIHLRIGQDSRVAGAPTRRQVRQPHRTPPRRTCRDGLHANRCHVADRRGNSRAARADDSP